MRKPKKEVKKEFDNTYQYYHWGPLLCKFEVVEEEAIDKMVAIGRKRQNIDYRSELAGHLDFEYGYTGEDRELFIKYFAKYIDVYTQAYAERFGSNHGGLALNDLWINFMRPGDFNPEHHHTLDVSFVLFCSEHEKLHEEMEEFEGTGPAPGQLVFTYGTNSFKDKAEWNVRNHVIIPKKGDLYIFPALLAHYVCPFKSDVERISISGNLSFRNQPNLKTRVLP